MSQSSQATPKPAAQVTTVKPAEFEVQVEVPAAASKEAKKAASDPFDALNSLLPSSTVPKAPETITPGLEVSEHEVTSETREKCGEREETLPPGYRFEDMPPAAADVKPKDVPKPLSTDEALDSLSSGLLSSTAPAASKMQQQSHVESVSASSAAPSNFAPPPAKKANTPSPPADKKAKLEKAEKLAAGISATPFKKGGSSPPADKKARMEAKDTKVGAKKDVGGDLSLDALGALGDLLPTSQPEPKPEQPPPKDIVTEDKHKKEKGVRTGENDNTIHPDYRFNKEELEKLPAPKPEPTMGTDEALDILSGGFSSVPTEPAACWAAPQVYRTVDEKVDPKNKAGEPEAQNAATCQVDGIVIEPVKPKNPKKKTPPAGEDPLLAIAPSVQEIQICHGAPSVKRSVKEKLPKQKETPVEDSAAVDLLSQSFVAPTNASKLKSSLPPAAQPTVCPLEEPMKIDFKMPEAAKKDQPDSAMLGDALLELGDLLPAAVPVQEPPKIRPEDVVREDEVEKEKGVRVGEDDETLPPDYRFSEDELMKLPAPKPEPTMNTGDALDILSGDFTTSSTAPAVQCAMAPPSAPLAQAPADFALDSLTQDFAACSAAPSVKCEPLVPMEIAPHLESGADCALDALSDTLKDITPAPRPVEVPTKDVVKEKKVVEERLIKMGERDDTLPPEYRPTEEDLKEMKKTVVKPKPPMSTEGALDLLSSEFATAPDPAVVQQDVAAVQQALESEPTQPMAAPVLDTLSDTLLPDDFPAKSKADKPKGKSKSKSKSKKQPAEDPSATDLLSAQMTTDVVPTAGGKK